MAVCRNAVQGAATVLHFAANMGGMGTIHDANGFTIYWDNHLMTTNVVKASIDAGVQQFFYASSACVYPEQLQEDVSVDASLREDDIWMHLPPKPQGLYGLEKLVSELVLQQFSSQMKIYVARFHNIFGPGGSWRGGREKAPAALLRKAIAANFLDAPHVDFEIWGDGRQRRSFLFIDDAVDGVITLLNSCPSSPVNIGSDKAVTISQLAEQALQCADMGKGSVNFVYDMSKPVGVASRNSSNDFAKLAIHWEPCISLEAGMRLTGDWIKDQITQLIEGYSPAKQQAMLLDLTQSRVTSLDSEAIVFAILLPITSRGSSNPTDCLENLTKFAGSLIRTSWRDTHTFGEPRFKVVVYLAIDQDDEFLLTATGPNKAEVVLRQHGVMDVINIICNHPRGHVCSLWRECARLAWKEGCDYMVLMGDDVNLQDEGWMRDAHAKFGEMSASEGLPFGCGCVAFTDTSFPGMPTFPIIHRTHIDIFQGEVVPEVFVNQDGDPFLFQLYRQWGCSTMFTSRISNGVGGEGDARYTKLCAKDWTFHTLNSAISIVESWLSTNGCRTARKLTIDVVVPCYRVIVPFWIP